MSQIAFLDWDGTTFLETVPLPYTQRLLQLLFKYDYQAVFLTNNSSRKTSDFQKILEINGLWSNPTAVVTSTMATIWYLMQEIKCQEAFLLGNDAMKEEFGDSGIRHSEQGPGVVVGFDTSLVYGSLQKAHELLLQGGFFVATHPDPTCPTSAGSLIDCGAIIAALETSTGRSPIIVGKPQKPVCDYLKCHYLQDTPKCLVMGDRDDTDGLLAQRLGAQYIRTYGREMLKTDVSEQVLDAVEESLR